MPPGERFVWHARQRERVHRVHDGASRRGALAMQPLLRRAPMLAEVDAVPAVQVGDRVLSERTRRKTRQAAAFCCHPAIPFEPSSCFLKILIDSFDFLMYYLFIIFVLFIYERESTKWIQMNQKGEKILINKTLAE